MAALSLNEAAELLGISNDMLKRLVTYGVVTRSVKVRWGKSDALHFSEADLTNARKALGQLKWLAVVTPDSWARLTADHLEYTLLSMRYERIAEILRPGHRMLFYVTGYSAFCGVADISGQTQRRRTLWPQGAFPYWVPLTPGTVREPAGGVKAKILLDKLSFVANKKSWEQYFRTTIRLLPESDFGVIEKALLKTPAAVGEVPSRSRLGR